MKRGMATAAMFAACLMLGAPGVLAQQDPSTAKTTNTYDANSTSEDIRKSCKNLAGKATAVGAVTVTGECNKAQTTSTVSAVSTTINMSNIAKCTSRDRVAWGSASANESKLVDGHILLTTTGNTYIFGAYCQTDSEKIGPSGIDIGETTNGLKNDAGKLAKR